MKPKSFALSLFTALTTFSSVAFACPTDPTAEFVMFSTHGTFLVLPYLIATSLLFLAFRNRWLEGSWKRWMKHSALAYVVGYTGWVVGSAISLYGGLQLDALEVVLFTTPLVFLSGHIALVRARGLSLATLDSQTWDGSRNR